MSRTLLFETKSVLAEMRDLRESVERLSHDLAGYDTFTLVNSYHKGAGKQSYYLKQKGVPGRKYLGKNSSGIVSEIKTLKYCKQLLKVIDRNIGLLEDVERDYVIPEYDWITALLPKVYRGEAPPIIRTPSEKAAEWKRRKEAEKAKYPPYRPEDLVHMAQDGTMMRSHSEVLIANYLLSLGIVFVYELPMSINGKKLLPDFTILSPIDNETVIIIEHQGAMDSETYQSKFIRTVLAYLDTKLVPNKDVFFTFNHLDRNLDLRQIDYILHTAFGYGCAPESGYGYS